MPPQLAVTGALKGVPSDAELDAAQGLLGLSLPVSYRRFARTYGYGVTAGLFWIYVPSADVDECDRLVNRSRATRARLDERMARDLGDFWFAPDGSRDLLSRAVPFGISENGDTLLWDPLDCLRDSSELAVYAIGPRGGVRRAGADLDDFLHRALEPGVGGILGRATFTLPARFEPFGLPRVVDPLSAASDDD